MLRQLLYVRYVVFPGFRFLHAQEIADGHVQCMRDFMERIQCGFHRSALDHGQMASGNAGQSAQHILRESALRAQTPDYVSQSLKIKTHDTRTSIISAGRCVLPGFRFLHAQEIADGHVQRLRDFMERVQIGLF